MISSSFADFTDWISDLGYAFLDGLLAHREASSQARKAKKLGKAPPESFTIATLGGNVEYS